jgi:hypothetical protein
VRFVVRQKADGLAAGHVSKGGAFDRFAFGLARELVLGGVAGEATQGGRRRWRWVLLTVIFRVLLDFPLRECAKGLRTRDLP